jgi:hypothetical protein
MAGMYLRFTTTAQDGDSHKAEGIFTAAYKLLDSGDLDSIERERLREMLIWFSKNLPTPPKNFLAGRAIFWFRPSAKECLQRVWEMVFMLREYGTHVTVYKCPRLANISFRDRFQVAAYPSDLDGRIVIQ